MGPEIGAIIRDFNFLTVAPSTPIKNPGAGVCKGPSTRLLNWCIQILVTATISPDVWSTLDVISKISNILKSPIAVPLRARINPIPPRPFSKRASTESDVETAHGDIPIREVS